MRVLISGARDWDDGVKMSAVLGLVADIDPDALVIEGEARGADTLARAMTHVLQLDHVGVEAKWRTEGRAAGSIRNARMLRVWKPDVVIWFHHDLANSSGTAHMVKIANAAGVPTIDGTQRIETIRMMLDAVAPR